MLSAACGDALGWPIESRGHRVGGTASLQPRFSFIEWVRREGGGYAPFQRRVPAGAYSDDTQLMLAVARSLGRGDAWLEHLTKFELPAWTLYELGGGGAVKRAARGWAKGIAPWEAKKDTDRQRYFAAGANGVAMRVLPHAIFGAGDASFDQVRERIVADGFTTHGHPRALVGALAAGYAMWTALRWKGKVHYGELIEDCLGERQTWSRLPERAFAPGWKDKAEEVLRTPYEELWTLTSEEMAGLLTRCQEAIGRGSLARDSDVLEDLGAFGKENGAGTRTAAVAIYLASRYVAKPTAGILAAAFARRADTDTIACMTGAMLGAFSGDDRVDGLALDLQDSGYVHRLAGEVARHEVGSAPSVNWSPKMKNRIFAELAGLPPGGKVSLPLFGMGIVRDVERPETKSANEVTIWWLSTELGQSLAITRIKRAAPRAEVPPSRRDTAAASGKLVEQLTMEATPRSEAGPAQSTWSILFVRNLAEALSFYNGILGVSVIRSRDRSAVLEGHIVLEESSQRVAPEGRGMKAPQVVGVFVGPDSLLPLHKRLAEAGYGPSEVDLGRNGERFRLRDQDGHLVEIFTSLPAYDTDSDDRDPPRR
ncbi:MAG: ADP-ribosylglycohydrolase family protein [Solirubrobacterales bacterium]